MLHLKHNNCQCVLDMSAASYNSNINYKCSANMANRPARGRLLIALRACTPEASTSLLPSCTATPSRSIQALLETELTYAGNNSAFISMFMNAHTSYVSGFQNVSGAECGKSIKSNNDTAAPAGIRNHICGQQLSFYKHVYERPHFLCFRIPERIRGRVWKIYQKQ